MSATEKKLSLAHAVRWATNLTLEFKADCDRVELAGSIRRCAKEIGDIEIVCIPRVEVQGQDLLGEGIEYRPLDVVLCNLCGQEVLKPLKGWKRGTLWKYAQFEYVKAGCKVDIFATDKDCWGVIYTLRTGPAEFSHRLVTPRRQNGLCPSHLRFRQGRIQSGLSLLDTPEEEDVFKALEVAWIPPEKR